MFLQDIASNHIISLFENARRLLKATLYKSLHFPLAVNITLLSAVVIKFCSTRTRQGKKGECELPKRSRILV